MNTLLSLHNKIIVYYPFSILNFFKKRAVLLPDHFRLKGQLLRVLFLNELLCPIVAVTVIANTDVSESRC